MHITHTDKSVTCYKTDPSSCQGRRPMTSSCVCQQLKPGQDELTECQLQSNSDSDCFTQELLIVSLTYMKLNFCYCLIVCNSTV